MRSLWKGPFVDKNLNINLPIRSRRSTILPRFENVNCKVYNGNKYVWLPIQLHHIGFKFGDFVLTKKKCQPKKKK